MRIRISRSGGLLGREIGLGDIETAELPPDEAAELTRLARSLARSPDGAGEPQPGADRFTYHLEIEDGERLTRLDLPEQLPDPARELVKRVRTGVEGA